MKKNLEKRKEQRRVVRKLAKNEERVKKEIELEIEKNLFKICYCIGVFLAIWGCFIVELPLVFCLFPLMGLLPIFLLKFIVNNEKIMQKLQEKAIEKTLQKNIVESCQQPTPLKGSD